MEWMEPELGGSSKQSYNSMQRDAAKQQSGNTMIVCRKVSIVTYLLYHEVDGTRGQWIVQTKLRWCAKRGQEDVVIVKKWTPLSVHGLMLICGHKQVM